MSRQRSLFGTLIRHGDVLLRRRIVPADRIVEFPAEDGRAVIARGERHGHSHSLPYGGAVNTDGGAGLAIAEDTRLEHLLADGNATGEHAAVDVAAGEYDVIRQSEVSPAMAPRIWSD